MGNSMTDFNAELTKAINEFVNSVSRLAQQAALESIQHALGGTAARMSDAAGSNVAITRSQRVRGRRSGEQLAELGEAFHVFVSKNPGMRIEQINKQLGTTTKILARPVKLLIDEGVLKTKGQRRSMTYFATERKKRS